MKTKLGWIAAGLLGIAAMVSHAQNRQTVAADNARFQLLQTSQGSIFRIDTQTGQTALYQDGVAPGTSRQFRYHFWRPVDERLAVHNEDDELQQAAAAVR
jgi:hypothetical protein